MEIYMTKQWACPMCSFPENFLPNCTFCDFRNEKAEPEEQPPTTNVT